MTKPFIGLPGRRKYGRDVVGFSDNLGDHPIDLYFSRYAHAVVAAGGVPVHLPIEIDPRDVIDRLDGVLLSGGADIEPRHYGATPDGNGEYEPLRDEKEFALLGAALEAELPVLGICRGIQVINVFLGGTLHQHKPDHARFDTHSSTRVHPVTITANSVIGSLYGETLKVNSLHHQVLDRLGQGLLATAVDDRGSIEAIEDPDRPLIGLQWHPEMHEDSDEPIFDWLVTEAAHRARP